ncbi:MAG: hypothetical protein CFH31_01445, partial [Alphaproteobacteria bacterium MarineAlpha9_Bin1]
WVHISSELLSAYTLFNKIKIKINEKNKYIIIF